MHMLRRILCLGLLVVAFTAAPASAQYDNVQATVQNNVITGTGCEPGSTVNFTLLSTTGQQVANLGSTTANAAGQFTATVSPAGVAAGDYTLLIACGSATDTLPVRVSSSGIAPGSGAGGGSGPVTGGVGSGLARTGSDSMTLVRGAAVLIAIGGLMLIASRRRKGELTPA
jgi:hypothetical protein